MRTLKKSLALVLALVMVLGLGVIGASADFTDVTDETDYAMEIQILTGLGVIDGVTEDTFKPEGTLTREQAAKIVAYCKLGVASAELISEAATAPFEDVAANRWSAGYIEYCANVKIVEGVSETEFNPSGTLTTAAFTKMLLVAVGFDPDENGLNGSSWAINTATLASENGIYDSDIGVSNKVEITRAQACRLAFLALDFGETVRETQTVVKYEVNAISPAAAEALAAIIGTRYNSFAQAQTAVTGLSEGLTYGTDYTITSVTVTETTTRQVGSLGDEKFGLSVSTTNTADDFGRPVSNYTADNGMDLTFTATPVLTYTAATTKGTIWTALGYTSASKTPTLSVITNGGTPTSTTLSKGSTDYVNAAGSILEVYKTGTDAYLAVIVETFVKKLAEDDIVDAKAATSTTDAVPAYIKLEGTPASYNATGAFVTDAFAEDDVVLYTKAKGEIKSAVKANVVAGTMTRYTANTATLTVGGTVYTKAAHADATVAGASIGFSTEKAFYVDAYNNVYLVGDVAGASVEVDGYFYVLGTQIDYTAGNNTDIISGATTQSAVVKARVVDFAGNISIVDLGVFAGTGADADKLYYKNTAGATTLINADQVYTAANVWAGYTVENGVYTIVTAATYAANAKTVSGVTVNKTVGPVDSKYLTSATTLTVINTADSTVKTTTGYANIALTDATVFATYASSSATTIDALYLVQTTTATDSSSAGYAYVADIGGTVSGGTEVTFYIDGEVVTYPVADTVTVAEGKVYASLTLTDGVVTAVGDATDVTSDGATVNRVTVADNSYFVAGSAYTYASSGCKVFNVTTGTPGTADIIEVGDYVVVVAGGTAATTLVYIVNAPSA